MKPSEFNIFISVESFDEKTTENDRNCYDTEKHIVSKLSKISIPNLCIINFKLKSRLCQNFTPLSLILSEKGTVKERPGWAGSLF